MDATELRRRIGLLPRLRLAELPTPLQECPRLSTKCGVRILFKRDDLTGLALGGNKTRQFEFILPHLLVDGVDTIVAGAFVQSNWCRQLTAASAALGMRTELVLARGSGRYAHTDVAIQGNLLLDLVLGADIRIVDVSDVHDLRFHVNERVRILRAQGVAAKAMLTFDPWSQALSAVAYVAGTLELLDQLDTRGEVAHHIYVSGATTTPAGMALTITALGRPIRLVSVTPIHWGQARADDIARIARDAAKVLTLDIDIDAVGIINDGRWVEPGYDELTEPSLSALLEVGRTEGILLDPIYTGRAMAALLADIQSGIVRSGETAVFVHTGGAPALFAYADEIATRMGRRVG